MKRPEDQGRRMEAKNKESSFWFVCDCCGISCLILTQVLISFSCYTVCCTVLLKWSSVGVIRYALVCVVLLLSLMASFSHLKCAFSNPGAIPRLLVPPASEAVQLVLSEKNLTVAHQKQPLHHVAAESLTTCLAHPLPKKQQDDFTGSSFVYGQLPRQQVDALNDVDTLCVDEERNQHVTDDVLVSPNNAALEPWPPVADAYLVPAFPISKQQQQLMVNVGRRCGQALGTELDELHQQQHFHVSEVEIEASAATHARQSVPKLNSEHDGFAHTQQQHPRGERNSTIRAETNYSAKLFQQLDTGSGDCLVGAVSKPQKTAAVFAAAEAGHLGLTADAAATADSREAGSVVAATASKAVSLTQWNATSAAENRFSASSLPQAGGSSTSQCKRRGRDNMVVKGLEQENTLTKATVSAQIAHVQQSTIEEHAAGSQSFSSCCTHSSGANAEADATGTPTCRPFFSCYRSSTRQIKTNQRRWWYSSSSSSIKVSCCEPVDARNRAFTTAARHSRQLSPSKNVFVVAAGAFSTALCIYPLHFLMRFFGNGKLLCGAKLAIRRSLCNIAVALHALLASTPFTLQQLPTLQRALERGSHIPICGRCHSYKPERVHHCSTCDRCIFKMDHHCPWVNNCIGYANQKFFLLFLLYVNGMCGVSLLAICLRAVSCVSSEWSSTFAATSANGDAADLLPARTVDFLAAGKELHLTLMPYIANSGETFRSMPSFFIIGNASKQTVPATVGASAALGAHSAIDVQAAAASEHLWGSLRGRMKTLSVRLQNLPPLSGILAAASGGATHRSSAEHANSPLVVSTDAVDHHYVAAATGAPFSKQLEGMDLKKPELLQKLFQQWQNQYALTDHKDDFISPENHRTDNTAAEAKNVFLENDALLSSTGPSEGAQVEAVDAMGRSAAAAAKVVEAFHSPVNNLGARTPLVFSEKLYQFCKRVNCKEGEKILEQMPIEWTERSPYSKASKTELRTHSGEDSNQQVEQQIFDFGEDMLYRVLCGCTDTVKVSPKRVFRDASTASLRSHGDNIFHFFCDFNAADLLSCLGVFMCASVFSLFTLMMLCDQLSALRSGITGIEVLKRIRLAEKKGFVDSLVDVCGTPFSWRWLLPMHSAAISSGYAPLDFRQTQTFSPENFSIACTSSSTRSATGARVYATNAAGASFENNAACVDESVTDISVSDDIAAASTFFFTDAAAPPSAESFAI